MTIARTSLRLFSSTNTQSLAYSNNKPMRWGILSAGRISADFVKAMSQTDGAEAIAVAARSSTAASSFATQHSIPSYINSYSDLLSNPSIDIVYIGNIADYHYEWTKKSILSGKPTVVEKPMSLCYNDTLELVQLAKQHNVFLMEGMWTRCFPAMHKLRSLINSNEIGNIIYCQGDFGWKFPTNYDSNDRIWLPNSGGITLDVGMYIAQLGQIAFPNSSLKNVQATGNVKNDVDYTVSATVTYDRSSNEEGEESSIGDGLLQMMLTGAANTEERCLFQGTKGRIIVDGPFHVPQRIRVQYDTGRDTLSKEEVFDFPLPHDPYDGQWNNPGSIGFVHEINEVSNAVREGKLQCDSYTWDDSLQVAKVIDEIVYQVRDERDVIS